MKNDFCLALAVAAFALLSNASVESAAAADQLTAYVGTYTRGKSEGIYRLELTIEGEKIASRKLTLAAKTANPSFLALHPQGELLYAVGELGQFQGKESGAVNAFAIAKDGSLSLINQQPSQGRGPCHLVVDATGRHVLVANYGGGSVASLPINDNGGLGPATSVIQHEGSSVTPRQKGPHAHSINLDAANRYAFAADLGLDKVLIYQFHEKTGKLTPNNPPFAKVEPGSGPRHFAFHPSGDFAYVINELSLTVTAFDYNAKTGALTPRQTISTIPEDITNRKGFSTAEVQVHPSGKFVYGSNRGHDTIVILSVDQKTGRLTRVGNEPIRGKTPRNFGLDPSGKYLLAEGQNSDTIAVFRIDPKSGKLSLVGEPFEVPTPVCVKFVAR